jgi:hypothetical protein
MALRYSGDNSAQLMNKTCQSPEDVSLCILKATSTRHGIGQMLKLLVPTQSTDVNKQSCFQVAAHRYVQNPQISFRVSNKRPAHVPVQSDQYPKQKSRLKPSDFTQGNTGNSG